MGYSNIYGDLKVPQDFIVPSGDKNWPILTWDMALGDRVFSIRDRFSFLGKNGERGEKIALLDALGFDWESNRKRKKSQETTGPMKGIADHSREGGEGEEVEHEGLDDSRSMENAFQEWVPAGPTETLRLASMQHDAPGVEKSPSQEALDVIKAQLSSARKKTVMVEFKMVNQYTENLMGSGLDEGILLPEVMGGSGTGKYLLFFFLFLKLDFWVVGIV